MILYIEPEEEITGAVARIRAAVGDAVVLVLPPGSRIATSRINFRLLEREAREKGLDLVCVSDEPGVRALAISAGVPAYDSVAAAERGLAEFVRQDERLAARVGEPPPVRRAAVTAAAAPSTAGDAREARHGAVPPAGRSAVGAYAAVDARDETSARAAGQRTDQHRRRSRAFPLVAAVLAVALVALAAYGAYTFVPTATITLQPALAPVGPLETEVVADPRVAVVDAGEGVVPAERISFPLSVAGDFPATGSEVVTTRATGSVRFRSTNTVDEVRVAAGTRVSTADGVDFETTEAVVVPRAVFDTGTPGTVDAAIRALRAGPRGNVGRGEITVAPASLTAQQVSVNNPQPTSGGSRVQQTVVARRDYDAALETLAGQLEAALTAAASDPALAPVGLTAYPQSAELGEIEPTHPPAQLVGTVAESFSLGLTADGSVLAVDEGLVDAVALEQLRALVPVGATLLEGSLEVSHAPGRVGNRTISFRATADGSAYRLPAREALLAAVRGKTVSEARAIMEPYGSVELSVWPEFIDRVPDQPSRINLTIVPPTETP